MSTDRIVPWKKIRDTVIKSGRVALKSTVEVISTGLETLDWAIGAKDSAGNYGLPRGSIVEIAGPESSGKTTHALQVCGNALQLYPNNPIVIIDAEKTTTAEYARQFGLDPTDERVLIYRPDNIRDVDSLVESILRNSEIKPSVIVVDSIPAIDMGSERDVEEKSAKVGERAGYLSEMISRWNSRIQDNKVLLILINQLRDNIQTDRYAIQFATSQFEKTQKTTGGRALKFFFSIRILLQPVKFRRETLECFATGEKQQTDTAVYLRAHIVKNKCSMAVDKFRKADYYMHLLKGIDRVQSLIDLGRRHKVIVSKGSWLEFDAEQCPDLTKYRAQGEDGFVEMIRNQPPQQRELIFESMLRAMGWFEVKDSEEIESKGTTIVDTVKGTVKTMIPYATLQKAQKQETVEERAWTLGVIEKRGRKFYYGNKSALSLDKLMTLLKEKEVIALTNKVEMLMTPPEIEAEVEDDTDDDVPDYIKAELEDDHPLGVVESVV